MSRRSERFGGSHRERRLLGSVRSRTTAIATLVVGSALAVSSVALVAILRTQLISNAVVNAKNEAVNIVSLVESGSLPKPIPIPEGDIAAQVIDPSGKVVAYTPNLAGEPAQYQYPPTNVDPKTQTTERVVRQITVPALQKAEQDNNYVLVATKVSVAVPVVTHVNSTYAGSVESKNGGRGSSSANQTIVATTSNPGTYDVFVWASLQAVDESVRSLIVILLVGFPLLLGVVLLATWVITKRAFDPIERIRIDVDEISGSNLSRRVYVPEDDDEIGRLAHTMNQMLDRLQDATEERKRFVADASHELKSPLSSLRTSLEIALRHADRADWIATARGSLAESQRMQHIIEDLLLLAKADVGQLITKSDLVDIDELIVEEATRLRLLTPIRVELAAMSAGRVRGDGERLRSVVRNLLENAVRHAHSRVSVALFQERGKVIFEVLDDGDGIPLEERGAIFERFTRLDESRSRDLGGSGLGLAIVKSIVNAHGGTVHVVDVPNGASGARFRVELVADAESILDIVELTS
jgi:signal transduction histidine kinase